MTRCFLALMLAVAMPAGAQTLTDEELLAAYQAQDFATVRTELQARIDAGATDGPTLLRHGRALIEGIGGPQDLEGGIASLEAAIAQGNLPAHVLLARVLLSSDGADAEAARLLRLAATRGDKEAKYYLALLYEEGLGVAQSAEDAQAWMSAAAADQYVPAFTEMARYALSGIGMPADFAVYETWLIRAADAGQPSALFELGNARAPTEAKELWQQAATQGHVPSMRALGTLYQTGANGVEPDAALARNWLGAAVNGGDVPAAHNLAVLLLTGEQEEGDVGTAISLLSIASDAGLARSSFQLAKLMEAGIGPGASPQEALSLYRLAATQGSSPAALRLGEIALEGELLGAEDGTPWVAGLLATAEAPRARDWLAKQAPDVPQAAAALGAHLMASGETETALPLLRQAAEAGNGEAQVALGQAFAMGNGVPLDYVAAHGWLNIAAAQGDREAASTRDTITALMTPDQLSEAHRTARAFLARSNP